MTIQICLLPMQTKIISLSFLIKIHIYQRWRGFFRMLTPILLLVGTLRKKLTQDLRMLLIRWKVVGFIDKLTYKRLMTSDGNIPRAYGLIKIHKIGNSIESHCIIYKQPLVLFFSFFTQHNY